MTVGVYIGETVSRVMEVGRIRKLRGLRPLVYADSSVSGRLVWRNYLSETACLSLRLSVCLGLSRCVVGMCVILIVYIV